MKIVARFHKIARRMWLCFSPNHAWFQVQHGSIAILVSETLYHTRKVRFSVHYMYSTCTCIYCQEYWHMYVHCTMCPIKFKCSITWHTSFVGFFNPQIMYSNISTVKVHTPLLLKSSWRFLSMKSFKAAFSSSTSPV